MINRIKKSLALKWMVFSILLATIPLGIAGFSIIQIYQKDLKKSVIGAEEMKAGMVVERTEAFFERITSSLLTLVNDEDFRRERSPSHIKNLLEKTLYQIDCIWELVLLDDSGKERVKVSKYRVFGPDDFKNESKGEMFGAASKGKTYFGEFYLTKDIVPTIGIAIPVKEYKGEPVGVLSAKIHLRYLWNLIPQTQMGEEGATYVVDKEGNLIAHPDTRQVLLGLNVRSLPMVDRVVSGKEGNLEFDHPGGERVLCVYKSIKKLGWGVIVQVPVKEAYKPLRLIARTAFLWILIALTIAIILSLFLMKRLTHPIKQLSAQMAKVSEGHLDVNIVSTTKDEMGVLTESFNQMIRDLKQSQGALREAEEKYRRIFRNSKDMVFITTFDGRFIEVNQAGVEILGYNSKEELMKIHVGDTYVDPQGRQRFQNEIARDGFIKDFEIVLKRKDGTPIDCLITANTRKSQEGHVIGYEGTLKDISVRKRIEEELLQRTEGLQTLRDLSSLLNQSLNLDEVLDIALDHLIGLTGFEMGRILILLEDGKTLETKLQKGYPTSFLGEASQFDMGESLAGKAIKEKQPLIVETDEHPSPWLRNLLKEEGIQSLISIPLITKERTIGTINLASRTHRIFTQREIDLLESIGNQIGLALENAKLFSDVAKGKSEWELTFDAVTDLITIRDKEYRILRANQAAFKRFGLKPEQMIGKRCFETLHHSDQPCDGCYVSKTLMTKKPASGERNSKYLKGIFQYHTFPVYDETGEITAVVDLAREITEEKQLEIEKEVVNHVNRILASSPDVRQVMKAVHSELRKVFNSERMTVTLLNEGGEGFQYFALEKDYEARELTGGVIYPKEGTSFGKAIDTSLPVIVSDTGKADSWLDQKLLKEGIRSSLVFPLEFKGKVIGTMNFGSKWPHHFSDHHNHFLRSVAPGMAISIQNALLFEETKKRLDELTILYEIMKISASSLNLGQMLREIIHSLNSFFKFEAFGIALIDENTKRLVVHPSYMGHPVKDIEKLELSLGKGITGWVAEKGEPLLVNDVRSDSRYIVYDESIGSEMCVPLKVGQKVIGVIDAQSRELNGFSEDDLRLLNIAGGQLATLIENICLYEEIKQSEEKYRTVVEGAHDGICVIGKDNLIKYANRKLSEIQGYPQEELMGMNFLDFLNEESKELMADRYLRRQKGEKLSRRFELIVLRKDGDIRNVEINAKVIKDLQGDINYIVFTKDITEKKKMEEQLVQTEKLRALGEMASGVAHDFNNALAVILGNTQLLLYTAKDEELKETLQTIEKVSRDAAQTVRRLQDFTRKRVHQELFKLDVNSIIKDAIEITKPKWKDEAQGRGAHIEMVSHFEEIPSVVGNASELREVITNLIFNAVEAMPEGGRIAIRTFPKRESVYVQISDTGTGMTEEVGKKVFEPFFTTKPFSHTGLGLSMSYGIIKRFGGEIGVESSVGKGTTFTLSFPIGVEGKEEAIPPSLIIKEGRKAKILVIDDEESVRSVLSRILSQVNHQVTVAENGEEGIRLFREKEFDMVLTDLGMPGTSGWEVCRAIKNMSPRTPVGMITGWGMEVDQDKIKEYELDFLISKPFDFSQILRVVDETIQTKEEQFWT
jgi:PAS domain S-box-containing protein